METITRYKCSVCGTEYQTKAMAEACEAFVLPPCPVAVGQSVLVYERYDPPAPDTVVSVRVAPSFYIEYGTPFGWETDYGEDALAVMRKKAGDIAFHQWLVTVKNRHLMNKDGDTADEVSLGNIMVDGVWLKDEAA